MSATILKRFTLRIHTNLANERWSKLWYLLRCLDRRGSGFLRLPVAQISELLAAASSTIYEWLRLGEEAEAFRRWRVSGGILKLHLGSLTRVAIALNLGKEGWGYTAEIPLHEINNLRAHATGIVAQKLQERSRYAAWKSLPAAARKQYKLPHPDAFFQHGDGQLCDDSPLRSIPCCLHIGRRRIFTSKGFIPYGASLTSIGAERNRSDRTLRRHFNQIGFEKKQLVQAKGVYALVRQSLNHVVDFESADGTRCRFPDSFGFGEAILSERPGGIGKECHLHVKSGRIFRYADKDWMYRTNIYKPVFDLKTMRYRSSEYKAALEAQEAQEKRQRDAELAEKLAVAQAETPPVNLAELLPDYARTKSDITDAQSDITDAQSDITDAQSDITDDPFVIINGQIVVLFHGERTTTSSRRGGTTLCKSVESSFENFSETHLSPGEKDGQKS